ncbi:MAG: hypothetical protein WAU47_04090 [Desulfobaccales bacterium]
MEINLVSSKRGCTKVLKGEALEVSLPALFLQIPAIEILSLNGLDIMKPDGQWNYQAGSRGILEKIGGFSTLQMGMVFTRCKKFWHYFGAPNTPCHETYPS